MNFVPLKDFADPELGSAYCAGLTYTVRAGNDMLAEKVSVWQQLGLIQVESVPQQSPTDATLRGQGVVN